MTRISNTDIPVAHSLYDVRNPKIVDISEQLTIISRAYADTIQDYNRDVSSE